MIKKMIKKGQTLPESHRQAISNALKWYWSMHDMSQERRDNISNAQKARIAKRDISQIKAHNDAIIAGTRKYYETHNGPWNGIPHTEATRKKISKSMKRYWNKRKHKKQVGE